MRININKIRNQLKISGFNVSKIKPWHVGTSRNCFILLMNNKKFVLKLFEK